MLLSRRLIMNRDDILIEAEELLEKLNDKNVRIFDATITDDTYIQEHIPGAAFFDHEKFSDPNGKYEFTILPDTALAQQIGNAGISEDSEVILYACGMLPYAARAWWILHYAGHNNVRVLNGGFSAWKKAGGKTEQASSLYEPAQFTGRFRTGMFADKQDVMDAMSDKNVVTINVLPPESFTASHIPNSVNISCWELMQNMDYFVPEKQIAEYLKEYNNEKRIITYCGGGIAASLSAMAHLMVGQENVAVYDGSLNEWLGDEMPVVGNGKWEIWKT